MAYTKVVVFDVIYNSAVEGSGECTKRSTNISPRARQWRASGAVGQLHAVEDLGRGGGHGGGPRARAEEGHGRARWRPHEEEEGGAGVTEGERTRWRRREEEGRRCSTRKKTSGSICARRWRLYIRENYSRCQPPTGSKNPLLPVRITNRE